MPRAPKHCGHPTCDNLTHARTYCPQHTRTGWQTRGAGRTSGRAHAQWRHAVLTRDNHTCRLRYPGCTGHATHADHIRPDAEGGARLDPTNGQAACEHCHNIKSRTEQQRGYERWTNRRRATEPPY